MLMPLPLLLNQLGYQPRPAGLVTRAQARAAIAMKILVEQQIVAKVWILLQFFPVAEGGPAAARIAEK